MAGNLPQSGVELIIEAGRYERGMKSVIQGADRADTALDSVVGAAGRAENALNSIKGNVDVRVNANVDDTEIRTTQGLIDSLTQTEDVGVNVDDTHVKGAQGQIDNLSQSEDVDIRVDDSEAKSALAGIEQKLQVIQTLSVINLAVTGLDALSNIENLPIFSTLLDMDSAIRTVNARTLDEIPNAAGIVSDLYTNAWGESREEIANLIVEMNRLGIANGDLAATGEDVFQVAAATGEDPVELLRRMDTLVKNGLVPSFSEAGDVIVGAFNSGLNRGDDFLETIDEYSQVIGDTGLSFNTWFEIMRAGLAEGVRDTDKLADAYKEMLNLTREEATRNASFGEETDRTVALQEIGLFDEAQAYAAGELAADEFVAALQAGLADVADPAKQRELALAIFSPTMVEDAGLPGLLAADLADSPDVVDAFKGIAEESANILNDSLTTAFTEATRTLETELAKAFEIPLTDFLDRLKGAAQTFADELQAGSSVSEAAAVALQIDPESIQRLESVIGNIAIVISEAIAVVLDAIGQGEAAAGLRGSIVGAAENQLAFDLKLANDGADVQTAVQTAIRRGVDEAEVSAAVTTAFNDALASGDVVEARALLESIQSVTDGQNGAAIGEELGGQIINGLAGVFDQQAFAELVGIDDIRNIGDATAAEVQAAIDQILPEIEASSNIFAGGTAEALRSVSEQLGVINFEGLDTAALEASLAEAENLILTARVNYTRALNEGDLGAAAGFAEQIQDPELIAEVEAFAAQLRATFNSAIASGDLELAGEVADQLGDEALQAQVDSLIADIQAVKTEAATALDETAGSFTDMKNRSTTDMNEVGTSAGTLKTTINTESNAIKSDLDGQKPVWQRWAENAVLWIDKIAERIVFVEGALTGFGSALNIPGVNNAAVPTAAGGGMFGAGQMVETGHGGVELITMPREGSIINAANSSQLMNAIQAVTGMGGGGGNTTNNYYINASQNLNAQSTGQATAGGDAFYRSLMGYGN